MSNVKELLEAFAGPAEPEKTNGASHRKQAQAAGGDTPYGLKALADECRIVATTQQGGRETALNLACLKMGSLIAGNELTQGTVERELREAAQRSGLDEREIDTKFRHSIPDGMKTPRSAPANSEPLIAFRPSAHTSNGNGSSNGNNEPESTMTDKDPNRLGQCRAILR